MSNSDIPVLRKALSTLLSELTGGSSKEFCWILNPDDPGLLQSLGKLSSREASSVPPSGGVSIAAHTDHICYSLNLMNRELRGENAFATADFTASWRRVSVSDEQWTELRDNLRTEVESWLKVISESRKLSEIELTGIIAGVAHIAYHFGAIRQMNRAIRGPSAEESKP